MKKKMIFAIGIMAIIFGGCYLTCDDDDTVTNELVGNWTGTRTISGSTESITFNFDNSGTFVYTCKKTTGTTFNYYRTLNGTYKTDKSTSTSKAILNYTSGTQTSTEGGNPAEIPSTTLASLCSVYAYKLTTDSLFYVDNDAFTNWEASIVYKLKKQN